MQSTTNGASRGASAGGTTPVRAYHVRLSHKLVATYVALGAVVTLLALLSGEIVHDRAERRRVYQGALDAHVQQLYSLVASASEEGFSYIVSGDAEERGIFVSKMASAEAHCESLLHSAPAPTLEAVAQVGRRITAMQGAGAGMFVAHDANPAFDRETYDAYERAIDGAWDAVSALDAAMKSEFLVRDVRERRQHTQFSAAIGVASLLLAVLLGSWLGRRIGGPLRALRDAAQAFGAGRYDVPLRVVANDEVGDLARSFEEMRRQVVQRAGELEASHARLTRALDELQENQQALVSAEKMAAMGRLTAGVAHELNSPLAAILGVVGDQRALTQEYLESIGDPDVGAADHREICREMKEALDIVDNAATRAAAFVRSIRAQTRQTHAQEEIFSVRAVVEDAINLASFPARAGKCEVHLTVKGAETVLFGNPSRLGQAVSNLLQNAVDATADRGGGKIDVSIESDAEMLRLRVADEGGGIPPEVFPRIFETLYTTKPYGRGTGLGLSIVKDAVERDFGGKVRVETMVGQGSVFSLELPWKETQVHAA